MKSSFVTDVITRLLTKHPDPQLELKYGNAFELLIATILAAQCTDARVNIVTKTFFKNYPTPQKIAKESVDVLAEKIKSTGFYRNKAKSLVACCQMLVSQFNGIVPESIDELAKLPGVGRKTASIVVGNAYGKPAIAVDTHVQRVSDRLQLSRAKTSEDVEKELAELVPEDQWVLFTLLLVLHGRYTCQSRRPRCQDCVLEDICPYEEKTTQ